MQLNTRVTVMEPRKKGTLGNLTLEDAKFFGRPNFSGIEDRFKDSRKKFTVLIPNDLADHLRSLGWNVKTTIPTPEELAEFPDRETVSHLRVMVDAGSQVYVRMGEAPPTELSAATHGIIDRSRISNMDMEIRAWEYDPEEKPGEYSARLVAIVANLVPNILESKYGILGAQGADE